MKNINIFYLISFAAAFAQGIFSMFMGIYLIELGYSESSVGSVLSLNTLSMAFGSIFSAIMIQRLGNKNSFLLSTLLISISTFFVMASQNILIIILFVILNGFGLSIRSTAEGMFLTENTPSKDRVKVFSNNFVIMNLGMLCASFFGGQVSQILSYSFDQQTTIFVIALGSSIVSAIFGSGALMLKSSKSTTHYKVSDSLKGFLIIFRPSLRNYIFYNLLVGIGAGMVVPFFSVYLKYSSGLSDGIIGSILSFSQFGCIVGGMLLPFLTHRFGRHKTAIFCQLLSIPFLVSIAFPQGIVFLSISFFMRNGLMNMALPLNSSIFMELVSPDERATLSSIISLTSSLSRAIGISIGGYLMHAYSYNLPYLFTIILYGLAVYIFYKTTKKRG